MISRYELYIQECHSCIYTRWQLKLNSDLMWLKGDWEQALECFSRNYYTKLRGVSERGHLCEWLRLFIHRGHYSELMSQTVNLTCRLLSSRPPRGASVFSTETSRAFLRPLTGHASLYALQPQCLNVTGKLKNFYLCQGPDF